MAEGVMAFDTGTALWLLMIVTLLGSGLGLVASASRRRLFDLGMLRRPRSVRLAATPSQLCEAGGV
jgi:hypothetical protein